MRTALISGAGIAGPTLAYFLARQGFRTTVVERSAGPRSSGSPVDVRGAAVAVASRMGIMAQVRQAATTAKTLSFVDSSGRRTGSLAIGSSPDDVELPRGDLARILFEAARDDAEFLFDDTITDVSPEGEVTFERAVPRRFDLVVGADGLHSNVRRLAFGPEPRFVRHIGVFVATTAAPGLDVDPTDVVMYNSPGKAVAIHPTRGKPLVAFMYRAPMPAGFGHRDVEGHRRMLLEAFDGEGWVVPQILPLVRETDDFYFDSVSKVRVPSWSRDKIALLGDAAAGVSLFGDGSSSAMTGAHTLAQALGSGPLEAALARYEHVHRQVVEPKARRVGLASQLLVPSCRAGIVLRNAASRLIGT